MIAMIVSRCHANDSYMSVIRYVVSRLNKGYKTFETLPRKQRRGMMRKIIKEHRENRELYECVMKGCI